MRKCLLAALFLSLMLLVSSAFAVDEKAKKAAPDKPPAKELLTRIDFGNTYVTGQSLKSGAIYLLQRKKNDVKSMLTYREDYRKEILESHDIRKKDEQGDADVKR